MYSALSLSFLFFFLWSTTRCKNLKCAWSEFWQVHLCDPNPYQNIDCHPRECPHALPSQLLLSTLTFFFLLCCSFVCLRIWYKWNHRVCSLSLFLVVYWFNLILCNNENEWTIATIDTKDESYGAYWMKKQTQEYIVSNFISLIKVICGVVSWENS